ncbi:MAG: DUF2333 family protein [Pseudomonadales bacterium]
MLEQLKNRTSNRWARISGWAGGSFLAVVGLLFLIGIVLTFVWGNEPGEFDIESNVNRLVEAHGTEKVTGSVTVATMITMADVLLNKPGGYLSNDIMPPTVFMDNVPNWEYGALVQMRDMARTLRNNMSRSQSQSSEDPSLVRAENQFYFDNNSWILPATESEYEKGVRALEDYFVRLGKPEQEDAQFYARADNIRVWLAEVETRLGSISQRLSASIGKRQLNLGLADDSAATQSTPSTPDGRIKTPWMELDDVFYEARGTTWALLHLLRAIEADFNDVLEDKNALVSLEQIIRELEPTQKTLWSPVVLNGGGFGVLANHSLVMGAHISRANAAIIDLRRLLDEG